VPAIPEWVTRGDLPPVGNTVLFAPSDDVPRFTGYDATWLNSGTAALSLALQVARAARPDVADPGVLLPAYGCPDLIAAALHAKVKPILVDVGKDDPAFEPNALESALGPNIVAVVAVNFLGIRERLEQIRRLLARRPGALLIEDNAQWFPEPMDTHGMSGDLVCLSIGRGKPVSLLGGGALLVRRGIPVPAALQDLPTQPDSGATYRAKVAAFNLLLNRRLYWVANRNPGLSLGETVFKPLTHIARADASRCRLIAGNARAYLARSRDAERWWDSEIARANGVTPLAVEESRKGRLLRYPVLCVDAAERERLHAKLDRAGLGVSSMYRRPLYEIPGVADKVVVSGNGDGAKSFASRLLTFPIHAQVRRDDVLRGVEWMRRDT